MNVKYLQNSLVLWSAYHGRVSLEWVVLSSSRRICSVTGTRSRKSARRTEPQMLTVTTLCRTCIAKWATVLTLLARTTPAEISSIRWSQCRSSESSCYNLRCLRFSMFQYNYYQDCYDTISSESSGAKRRKSRAGRSKREVSRGQNYQTSLDISSNTAVSF